MKRWVAALILVSSVCAGSVWAAKGPEVDLVDDKLSINAEAVSLSRLLQLVDLATGMKSKVPPELANRNISVKFSGLNVTDGVRKIFQGQPFDYVLIQGQGIIVTAASQTLSAADSVPAPAYNPTPSVQTIEQPFVQDFPAAQVPQMQQPPQGQQPAMVQTPFGPIPNPRAQQPNSPVTTPVQQNSLFPQPAQSVGQPIGQPIGQPVPALGIQPGSPTPFGIPNTFGTPNQPTNNQNNGLFSTTPLFGSPGTQQR